jgi:hypothetical protein
MLALLLAAGCGGPAATGAVGGFGAVGSAPGRPTATPTTTRVAATSRPSPSRRPTPTSRATRVATPPPTAAPTAPAGAAVPAESALLRVWYTEPSYGGAELFGFVIDSAGVRRGSKVFYVRRFDVRNPLTMPIIGTGTPAVFTWAYAGGTITLRVTVGRTETLRILEATADRMVVDHGTGDVRVWIACGDPFRQLVPTCTA